MSTQRLLNMRQALEEAKSKRQRAEGSIETLLQQLKDEHGCTNTEEAETKLKKLKERTRKAQEDLETALEEIEEQYGDILSQA